MELDCETARTDEVTLVTAWLQNERATDRRVRLRNRLDGPVLPPRRNGEPEPGWDRDGVTIVVPGGERIALGYACPAEPESPPATVEWVDADDESGRESPVAEAMRRLGDARPPRAVLGGEPESTEKSENEAEQARPCPADRPNREPTPEEMPPDVETLLRPYRERVERVEALGAADVPTAADLLETGGGLADVEAMGTDLDDSAVALRALAAEATALAARAEAATPPTETLRRLS